MGASEVEERTREQGSGSRILRKTGAQEEDSATNRCSIEGFWRAKKKKRWAIVGASKIEREVVRRRILRRTGV